MVAALLLATIDVCVIRDPVAVVVVVESPVEVTDLVELLPRRRLDARSE